MFCDICGKETDTITVNYPVIEYGRDNNEPKTYIQQIALDMCQNCLSKTLMVESNKTERGKIRFVLRKQNAEEEAE